MTKKIVTIETAAALLKSGEVVAMPTETVYGLAGWINSDEGLRKIFSTKERPFFDPLIVHVSDIVKARTLSSDWTDIHEILGLALWPGPLTLITKKITSLNPLITSGLDSVGIRVPRHPVAIELLKYIEGGLAAPSANKFGKTSPTTSDHVYQEFGEEVAILEGGQSDVGIESTVVGVSGKKVEIYRPGQITASKISEILKQAGLKDVEVTYAQSPVAPGQLKHHYMPKIPLVIVSERFDQKDLPLIEQRLGSSFSRPVLWKQDQDPLIASRELYEKMRSFDEEGYDLILSVKEAHQSSEDWMGIWNRLGKAKSLEL